MSDLEDLLRRSLAEPKARLRRVPKDRPDEDQMYLVERLADSSEIGRALSPAALQRLNTRFGRPTVTTALRRLHGWPPAVPIRNLYAYLEAVCRAVDVEGP